MNNNFKDWESKYWQRRAEQKSAQTQGNTPEELPHYEPLHITQQREKQAAHRNSQAQDGWRDIDPITAMHMNQSAMAARGTGPSGQTVQLREGSVYYKKIDADAFGHTTTMVRTAGPVTGVENKEFELKQECNCYLIDNLQVVDLGSIEQSKMLKLVEVRAPFIGSLFVERSAIVTPLSNEKQLLKG